MTVHPMTQKKSVKALKRVCLLYTGGTIGMIRKREGDEEVLTPPTNEKKFLESLHAEKDIQEIADVKFEPIKNEDSTNMVPQDWTDMANAVHERLNDYDGFVIAHGTDTMHFSASALAFAFGKNLKKPIVFTGSQTAPDVPYGDAKVNLLRAVKVSCEELAEVVIAFGEFVFRGCRAQKKDEKRFDAFESPAEFPLGYITEDIVLSRMAKKPSDKEGELEFLPRFAKGIVQISLIPGLEPDLLLSILENPNCKGVVLQSFGAGNVPNKPPYSFEDFIRRATASSIPVIIASQFPANSTLASHSYYAPGKAAVEAGAIPTGNMTNAAATVKFRWVLERIAEQSAALSSMDKRKLVFNMMNTNYVEEITVSKSEQARLDL